MSIGDLPKIPDEYRPRIQQLNTKLGKEELTVIELLDHVMTVLGRVRINAEGIQVWGEFGRTGLTGAEFRALMLSMEKGIDFSMRYRGREILIKQGSKINRIRIDFNMKKRPASAAEIADPALPMIEWMPPDANGQDTSDHGGEEELKNKKIQIKVHRMEALAGWLGDGWEEFARMLEIGLPALALTQKSTMDRIGESVPGLLDAILKRCGV